MMMMRAFKPAPWRSPPLHLARGELRAGVVGASSRPIRRTALAPSCSFRACSGRNHGPRPARYPERCWPRYRCCGPTHSWWMSAMPADWPRARAETTACRRCELTFVGLVGAARFSQRALAGPVFPHHARTSPAWSGLKPPTARSPRERLVIALIASSWRASVTTSSFGELARNPQRDLAYHFDAVSGSVAGWRPLLPAWSRARASTCSTRYRSRTASARPCRR